MRRPPDRPRVFRAHPEHLALLSNQQNRVVRTVHESDTNDRAVAVTRPDSNDTDSAARLHPIFVKRSSLPVALLGHAEQGPARVDQRHCHDFVVVPEPDAPYTPGDASHGPQIVLHETDRHAVAGADEDLTLPVRQFGPYDRIVLRHPHRDHPCRAGVAEHAQIDPLGDAAACPHDDKALARFGREVAERL